MVMTKAQLYNPRNNPANKLPSRVTLTNSLTGTPAPKPPETLLAATTSASLKPSSQSSLLSGGTNSATSLVTGITTVPPKPASKNAASVGPPQPLLTTLITTGAISKPPEQSSLPSVPLSAGGEVFEDHLPLSGSDLLPGNPPQPTPRLDTAAIGPGLLNSLIQQMISYSATIQATDSSIAVSLPPAGMLPTLVPMPH